ncbi:hypothetical protein OG985_49765 (plasmid) [Streptomyces sp. NBC_00289]|uniref:hypothetical protein n=1 Tax=Streptomyces sp. NBC_00289 TaxID=2975703 RepID=UPI002F91011A
MGHKETRAAKLTRTEKQRLNWVNIALDSPESEHLFPQARKLGMLAGVNRQGPLRAKYHSQLQPGETVEVDLACTGGRTASLTVTSSHRSKTIIDTCPNDTASVEPHFFTAMGSVIDVFITGRSGGAVAAITHQINTATAPAQDRMMASQAQATLFDDGEKEYIGGGILGVRELTDLSPITVKKRQAIKIQAACKGVGSVTISAVSGKAMASKKYPCWNDGSIATADFGITSDSRALEVRFEADKGTTGGIAYGIYAEQP